MDIWNMFFSRLSWVIPKNIKDANESWSLWKVDKNIRKIWRTIPASIIWGIWTENKHALLGEKMVEFLQRSVGITHRNHAESIATFIKKGVDGRVE
ncbi:hypothetical protein P3S68_013962 [Capsicum galapagoense]